MHEIYACQCYICTYILCKDIMSHIISYWTTSYRSSFVLNHHLKVIHHYKFFMYIFMHKIYINASPQLFIVLFSVQDCELFWNIACLFRISIVKSTVLYYVVEINVSIYVTKKSGMYVMKKRVWKLLCWLERFAILSSKSWSDAYIHCHISIASKQFKRK